MEVTPNAVTKAVGCMPKTGCNTDRMANIQIILRITFRKIEAEGIREASKALLDTRITRCSMMSAMIEKVCRCKTENCLIGIGEHPYPNFLF